MLYLLFYISIPKERVCKHCNNGSVEDEFHFAFECHKYDNLRNNCNPILKNIFQLQNNSRIQERFVNSHNVQ